MNKDFSLIDWDTIISETSVDDFPQTFNNLVLSVLQNNCPIINQNKFKIYKSSYKKKREILARKIRKYNKQTKNILNNPIKILNLKNKIKNLHQEQKQLFLKKKELKKM